MEREIELDRLDDSEQKNISKKDLAKKMRREAYLKAKAFKKTDPREIARKAAAKEHRKAIYQKAKERNKAFKKSSQEKAAQLKDKIMLAIDLPQDSRPLAPVIPIDILKQRQKQPR